MLTLPIVLFALLPPFFRRLILHNTTGSSAFHGEGSSRLQNAIRIASDVSRCLEVDTHSIYQQDHSIPYYDLKLPTSVPFHPSPKVHFEAFGLSDATYWNCAKYIRKEIIDSQLYAKKFCGRQVNDRTEREWISKCQAGTPINDIKTIMENSDEGFECKKEKVREALKLKPDRPPITNISTSTPIPTYSNTIGFPHELLFVFRGTIKKNQMQYSHGVRQLLYKLYGTPTESGEEHSGYVTYGLPGNIVVAAGGSPQQYTKDMQRSTFCLAPGGWWAFTPRPERAISVGCIPVILSNSVRLPGGTWLEWNAFSIRFDINEILNDPLLLERTLRSISKTKVQELRKNVIRASQILMWNDRPFDVLDWVLGQAYVSSQHAIQTDWRRSRGNRVVPWQQNGTRQCRLPSFEAKRNCATFLSEKLMLTNDKQGNEWISKRFQEGTPFVVGRLGRAESCLIDQYLSSMTVSIQACKERHPDTFNNNASRIYPESPSVFKSFAEIYTSSLKQLDHKDAMATFPDLKAYEDTIFPHMKFTTLIKNRAIEPFHFDDPWSKHLEGKTILIVHPFVSSIKRQYSHYKRLFVNKLVLPSFTPKFVQMPPALGNATMPHDSWMETLDAVKHLIDSVGPFDVAIVTAGVYTMPLAVHCKLNHKATAITMGGGSQLMFGLKGKRWDDHPEVVKLYNKYWMYPLEPNNSH